MPKTVYLEEGCARILFANQKGQKRPVLQSRNEEAKQTVKPNIYQNLLVPMNAA